MSFQVGQRVVCVHDDSHPTEPLGMGKWIPSEAIRKGEIYTITSIYDFRGFMCFQLAEVSRAILSRLEYGEKVGYGAWRFRPLEEKKYDISIFNEICRGIEQGKPIIHDPVSPEKVDVHSGWRSA